MVANFKCLHLSERLLTTFALGIAKQNYCGHGCLCLCVLSTAFLYYSMHVDVTLGNGRGCPLGVQYWVDLQSDHGFRHYDIIHLHTIQLGLPCAAELHVVLLISHDRKDA